jgi:hypothetical protein
MTHSVRPHISLECRCRSCCDFDAQLIAESYRRLEADGYVTRAHATKFWADSAEAERKRREAFDQQVEYESQAWEYAREFEAETPDNEIVPYPFFWHSSGG